MNRASRRQSFNDRGKDKVIQILRKDGTVARKRPPFLVRNVNIRTGEVTIATRQPEFENINKPTTLTKFLATRTQERKEYYAACRRRGIDKYTMRRQWAAKIGVNI